MSDQTDAVRSAFVPSRLTPAELEARRQSTLRPPAQGEGSFAPALREALRGAEKAAGLGATPNDASQVLPGSGLRLSAHAEARLRTRDIRLTSADAAQINQAVEIAQAKGAQESLILYDDLALIVSIRHKVVITALELGENAGGAGTNVFTHIDSAVVLPGSRKP